MLEDVVASVLGQYSDKYLQDFDANALKISWTKGDVTLNNLTLKPSAFQDLHPKIRVVSGHIRQLKIKISYLRLKSEPVFIKVDGLLVLLGTQEGADITREDIDKLVRERLMDKLQQQLNYQIMLEESLSDKKSNFGKYVQNLAQ